MFSSVKTRKPKRSPPNATDGSGKSKLNFMNARPRGGTNTSLVDVSGNTSAAVAGDATLGTRSDRRIIASAAATAPDDDARRTRHADDLEPLAPRQLAVLGAQFPGPCSLFPVCHARSEKCGAEEIAAVTSRVMGCSRGGQVSYIKQND